jgi:hypothetical protein
VTTVRVPAYIEVDVELEAKSGSDPNTIVVNAVVLSGFRLCLEDGTVLMTVEAV